MAQMTLKAAVALSKSPKSKCPFGCGKAPHKFESKKQSEDTKIESIPSQLGDLPINGVAPGKWGRARHHIIPAKQCFAIVRRLARMAMAVGYDINNSENGIGLPTVNNPYTYNGVTKNFGEFTDPKIKEDIAFDVMDNTGKQWHVGNHSYKIKSKEPEEPEKMKDEGKLPHLPYDLEVIDRLIREMSQWEEAKLCQKTKDDSDKYIKAMNAISKEIRGKLDAFKKGGSEPFFVSAVAKDWKPKKYRK